MFQVPRAIVLHNSLVTSHAHAGRWEAGAFAYQDGESPLEHVAGILGQTGVREVLVLTNDWDEDAIRAVEASRQSDTPSALRIHTLRESGLMGTAGSLLSLATEIGSEPFLLILGHVWADLDFAALAKDHASHQAVLTAVVQDNPKDVLQQSVAGVTYEIGDADQIVRATRNGTSQGTERGVSPAGIFLCEARVLDAIPAQEYQDLEEQLITRLLDRGARVLAHHAHGKVRVPREVAEVPNGQGPVHTNGSTHAPGAETGRSEPARQARGGWCTVRRSLKRALDLAVAAVALLVLLPLLPLLAIAIKLDSPGGIFFRQVRCGRDGRNFTMYKFRSMVTGAHAVQKVLRGQARNQVNGPMFKLIQDPRVTRLGRLLRRTCIDELPQLWNVLRGDMSLVGPRPLAEEEMHFAHRWRQVRLQVRPGLTGLWQVHGRRSFAFQDWIKYDIEYVQRWSLRLDLAILCRTIPAILGSSGAAPLPGPGAEPEVPAGAP